MEVLLRNVPQDLSDNDLRRELVPYMNALGIQEWACEKVRRRVNAWITFLKESDGRKFLNKHEKLRGPPKHTYEIPSAANLFQPRLKRNDTPRLHILRTAVFVEKSNRPVDKYTIAYLKQNMEEKIRASTRDPKAPALTFPVSAIAVGDNYFRDSQLHFAEQSQWDCYGWGKFGQGSCILTFEESFGDIEMTYRMDIPFNIIQDLIAAKDRRSFFFVLIEPPRMYQSMVGPYHDRSASHTKWERIPSFSGAWSLHPIYVQTALVYRLRTTYLDSEFDTLLGALKSRDLLSITRYNLPISPLASGYISSSGIDHLEGMLSFERNLATAKVKEAVPFPLRFQVQALVKNNYLRPHLGTALLNMMVEVALDSRKKKVSLPITTDSMKQLFQRIPFPCPGTDPAELDVVELLKEVIDTEYHLREDDPLRDKIYGAKIPSHQAWVFKVMVTPTRMLFSGPEAESRNRVLRMFPKCNDYFLRVTFCDEDGQDLRFNPKISHEIIYERYRKVLGGGISVAGRKFSFLGFSHSSLRSHSVWFMATFLDENFQNHTYDTILSLLGDFEGIRVPAKCAARIGQAFSETPYAVPLIECGIQNRSIPDVKSADGSRVFSDGVGTISWDALTEIWPYLSMRSAAPTCLQIRWGGYKGMLSLDTTLKGKIICVRPESMMKFPSTDLNELGICDAASKPLRLVLNRQMIKILEDMGTEDAWFLDQQQKALDILRGVTAKAINTSTFLEYQSVGINMGLPKLIKQLDRMNIDYRRDQFLRSAVEHVVLRELRLLKHKARIPVDQGVTLFGIMDETGFLEEGEIYVTYDKTYGTGTRRINATLEDGTVLVTRSPALHPGDIQRAEMVTPPQGHPLRDLQNCIVFSQKGARDLPSQLSGGDLDGDLYNIIWDHRAAPKFVYGPADYPRVAPEPLNRAVTRHDIADFFINFMKTDVLGMIATRHVMLADKLSLGTCDPSCIALAEMHSTAVDFSKTGIPVNVKNIPKAPRFRPDFLAPAPPLKLYDVGQIDHIAELEEDDDDEDGLGGATLKYYPSEKILGHLYRNVDEKKIWDEDIHRDINMSGPSVWDQLLGLVESKIEEYKLDIVYSRRLAEAWKIRNLYDSTISDNMWHFSDNPRTCLSEVEVFCGFILNKRGSQTRRQRDSSIKLKEETDRFMAFTVKQIRDRGMGTDGDAASSVTGSVAESSRWREDVIELCWACVAVGCVKEAGASPLYHGTGELQSFRVVAACCLLKELNNLSRKMEVASEGGYVGVRGGKGRKMVLPIR